MERHRQAAALQERLQRGAARGSGRRAASGSTSATGRRAPSGSTASASRCAQVLQEIAGPGRRRPRTSRRAWSTSRAACRRAARRSSTSAGSTGRTRCASGTGSTRASPSGSRCRDLPRRPLRPLRHARALRPRAAARGRDQRQDGPLHRRAPPRGLPAASRPSVDARALRRRRSSGAGRRPSASASEDHREVAAPGALRACSSGASGSTRPAARRGAADAARHPHAGAVQGRRASRRTTARSCARSRRRYRLAVVSNFDYTPTAPGHPRARGHRRPLRDHRRLRRGRLAQAQAGHLRDGARPAGRRPPAEALFVGDRADIDVVGRPGRWAWPPPGSTATAEPLPAGHRSRPTSRSATWRSSGRILGIP